MNPSKLTQPEYLHVLINHLPIIGLMVAAALLTVFLLLRNRGAVSASMIAVGVLALSAWPVLVTGQQAYSRMDQFVDDEGKAYLDRHMELAETWIYLFVATSIVAGVGVVVGRKKPGTLVPFAIATLVLTAGSLMIGAVIAENGGMIRHPEFRSGPPPEIEHGHDHVH